MSLPGALPNSPFSGIPFSVSKMLCVSVSMPARRHRKKRINKKWRKRYGFKVVPCRGQAMKLGEFMVICPHVWDAIPAVKP